MERINIVPARIVDSVVEVFQAGEYYPADDVIIESAGVGDSVGFVLIGNTEKRYITNTQVDLAFMLDRLVGLCSQVEAIGNKATWVTAVTGGSGAPAVGVIAPFPDLQAVASEVATIRTELENLELK